MFRRSVLVILVLFGAAAAVAAQTPVPAQPAATVPPFVVQSDNGDNRLQLTGLFHVDGRFAEQGVLDQFFIRRARIALQGRVARVFEFYLNPDFAGGNLVLFDAYMDTRFSNALRLRVGKAKVPFGLERLQSAAATLFLERAFPTALVPNRDVGLQALGDLAGGVVSYGVSLTNGTVDGGSADVDTNEGKDVAARIIVRPLARDPGDPLSGLSVGIAGSRGDQPTTLGAIRTSAQQTFFAFAPGTAGTGTRTRVSPQGSYFFGPFGAIAEYVRSTGEVQRASVITKVEHRAWQIAASWVLTGENASDRGVRPRNDFDPVNARWGAVQVAARYHAIRTGDERLLPELVVPGASHEAEAVMVGANWYLNPYVRWMLNVERTVFDGDPNGSRPAENALLVRAQLSF